MGNAKSVHKLIFCLPYTNTKYREKEKAKEMKKVLTGLKVQMLGGVGWNIIMRS